MRDKEIIARRVAKELKNGALVNLGIGLPTMVADFMPSGVQVLLHAENGMIGTGPQPQPGYENSDLINAGGGYITAFAGAAIFDSAISFALARGGHLDVTVLGGLQVDERGRLANWMVPGKLVPGMGGAMDLATGVKKVIVAMTHTAKGASKIVRECSLPLTSVRRVDLIVTELAVIQPTDKGLVLLEIAPDVTIQQVIAATDAQLLIGSDVGIMDLA